MKSMKRGIAVLLAALLMMPTPSAKAEETVPRPVVEAEEDNNQLVTKESLAVDISNAGSPVDETGFGESSETAEEESAGFGDSTQVEGSGTGADGESGAAPEVLDDAQKDGVDSGNVEDGSGNGSEDAANGTEGNGTGDVTDGSESNETGDVADGSESNEAGDVTDGSDDNEVEDTADGSIDAEDDTNGNGGNVETGDAEQGDSDAGAETDSDDVKDSGDESETEDVDTNQDEENLETEDEMPEWDGDGILFSTGGEYRIVVTPGNPAIEEYGEIADVFGEDGSYTIRIPEEDPFFPYEVQFADPEFEEVQNVWFMTPDSVVEFGGHAFRVEANFTGKVVTQFSLNIAGDTVVVYPAKKTFGGAAPMSLLPLKEEYFNIDLTGYTPLELSMVSISSIFAGHAELKDTDRIIWTDINYYRDNTLDYTISGAGDSINLSYADDFQMIVGEPDQLAADNVRYIVYIEKSSEKGWMTPLFYGQNVDGIRTQVTVKREYQYTYEDYVSESIYLSSTQGIYKEGYLALQINKENYGNTKFTSVRAFEGQHKTAEEAMAATEVTDKILCTDMTQKDAGYKMSRYTYSYITLVSFDGQGNVTGCLPVSLYYSSLDAYLSVDSLRTADGSYVRTNSNSRYMDGCYYYTHELYPGNSANEMYAQKFAYYVDGDRNASAITAAYVGVYSTIAEAKGAGAENVKYKLFESGYLGDYSKGITFTIFIGEDGTKEQQVYKYNIKVVEGEGKEEQEAYIDALNSGTAVRFTGLMNEFPSIFNDSYAENNYIVFLVDEYVDRSNLAPIFTIDYEGLKLYTAGSTTPEVSGKSYHDFSKGPVQYTASSEDKKHSKNYWVYVVTKEEGAGQIFVNSLTDSNVETITKDGIVYTTREVLLDSIHNYLHDIALANIGTQAIENLAVELVSDSLELDDYWTLKGNHALSGFTTVSETTGFGKLSNLALLRLRSKADVTNGAEVSGTLTFKSGETVLMVMTLTGTVGDPTITTTEIPEAVKYVPYGTMIQSSNKYSWNTVTFELVQGTLPGGMVIKPNGELYGVPTEAGEFTFSVRMHNSHRDFNDCIREFTLVVKENTDANVDGATDENYELTERVAYLYDSSLGDQMMVSQGEFGEFIDLWLDGVKLERGVDYKAESGSTRITVYSQTLGSQGTGTHTLGIEFRTSDTASVKSAAQNYVVDSEDLPDTPDTPGENRPGGIKPGENTPGGNTPGNSSGNTGSTGNNNAASGNSSNNGTVAPEVSTVMEPGTTSVAYTVQPGDTLWKIAVKFYGDGNQWRKIYEDNKNVIRDPNKIYVGQVLIIQVAASVEDQDGVAANQESAVGGTYTVQPGDSLWKIATKVYGNGRNWRRIYEANKDKISDASKIYAGQVLVIPE